jgi:hypothetical protein
MKNQKKRNKIYTTPERSEGCIKWRIKMVSKEKKILFESFDKRNLKSNYTKDLMDNMLNSKRQHIRRWREEELDKKVQEWKKEGTYDINQLGHTQKSISPTSRSTVRPFKPQTLQEQRIIQWDKELEEIQEWLDK